MTKIFFAVLAVAIVLGCESESDRKAEMLKKLTTPYTKPIPRVEPAGKPLEPIGLRPSQPSTPQK